MKRVCIVGCGAIGSLYAVHLARVVEVWALVRREEHALALKRDGINLKLQRNQVLPRASALVSCRIVPDQAPEVRVPIRVRVDPGRFQLNDVPLLVGDPRRIRDELGWEPTIPLSQTIDDLLAYWRGTLRKT